MSDSEHYKITYTEDGMSLVTLPYKEYWGLHSTITELATILNDMVSEQVDYMVSNNLGNPEEQRNIKRARAILWRTL